MGADGRYYCAVYEDRLGPRRTVSGKFFVCVTIRELAARKALYYGCAYNRKTGFVTHGRGDV